MRAIRSGRLIFPASSAAAKRYARENLVSLQRRSDRLAGVAGIVRLRGEELADERDDPCSFAIDGGDAVAIREVIERVTGITAATDWLVVRDYNGSDRVRPIMFLWSRGESRPSFMVRMRPHGAPGDSLEFEGVSLRTIRGAVDSPLRQTIPEVVAYEDAGEHELLVTTIVDGAPLWMSMQRSLSPLRGRQRQFAAVGEWLGKMQSASRRAMGNDAPPSALADDMAPTFVHGDFWPRNVLFRGSRLTGVVDWEHARAVGPPWRDLFGFAILSTVGAPRWRERDRLELFKEAFIDSSSASRNVALYLQAWADASGTDRGLLRRLLELYLLDAEALASQEEQGWRSTYPWQQMRAATAAARHCAFCG